MTSNQSGLRHRGGEEISSSTPTKVLEDYDVPEFTLGTSITSTLGEIILQLFFSKVEIVNDENVPIQGPCIVFGNHQNQFVDPMCLVKAAQRPVSFIIAEVSMHLPIIGTLAKMAGAVPVVRPQDLAVKGPGEIINIDIDSRTIEGSQDTKFTEIAPGSLINVSNKVGQFVVENVLSDTKAVFKELPSFVKVDLEPLQQQKQSSSPSSAGLKYKITPKVQQSNMFEEVYARLREGGCIGIFPEGGSHDQTDLLPFKVGVAIMALDARAQGIPVQLIPIGINYFAGHAYRSKVFVDCGHPVEIPEELVEQYKDKSTRREACATLLKTMRHALEYTCITAPDFETLKAIRTVRRMYQNKVRLTPKEYMDLNQRFFHGYALYKDRPEFQELMADVKEYLEAVRSQGLKDKQVRDLPPLGSVRTLLNATWDCIVTAVMVAFVLPVIVPGVFLYLPIPIYISRKLPHILAKAAEESSVKNAARDVAASQQIVMAMKLVPILHVAYSILWVIFFSITWPYYKREPGTWGHMLVYNAYWFLPLCFFFLGPYYSFYACPLLAERLGRRIRLLPRYALCIRSFFSLSRRQPAAMLRQERRKLTVRIQQLVETFLRENKPDWSSTRIINQAKMLKARTTSDRKLAAEGDLTMKLKSSQEQGKQQEQQEVSDELQRWSIFSDELSTTTTTTKEAKASNK